MGKDITVIAFIIAINIFVILPSLILSIGGCMKDVGIGIVTVTLILILVFVTCYLLLLWRDS